MRYQKLVAAAGIGLTLGMYAPSIRAHAKGASLGAGISAEAAEQHNESDPKTEDEEISRKITEAKAKGKDTSSAEMHQKAGEAEMSKGNNEAALKHFEEAEHALGESE